MWFVLAGDHVLLAEQLRRPERVDHLVVGHAGGAVRATPSAVSDRLIVLSAGITRTSAVTIGSWSP